MLANLLGNIPFLQVRPPRHLGTSALAEKVRAAHSEESNTERSGHAPVLERWPEREKKGRKT